jgi:hypothetical protein
MVAISLLLWALITAFTASGVVMLIRQIPWVDRQMMAGKKPWVCNLCMSWWTSPIVVGFWHLMADAPLRAAIPAFALTLICVNVLGAAHATPDFDIEEIPEEKS